MIANDVSFSSIAAWGVPVVRQKEAAMMEKMKNTSGSASEAAELNAMTAEFSVLMNMLVSMFNVVKEALQSVLRSAG